MWLEIVVAVVVAVITLATIVRDDRPRTVSAWAFSLFAAIQFGGACALAVWFARRLIEAGWAATAFVLLTGAAILYIWIGFRYAADELRGARSRRVGAAIFMFFCWPVVLFVFARIMSGDDD